MTDCLFPLFFAFVRRFRAMVLLSASLVSACVLRGAPEEDDYVRTVGFFSRNQREVVGYGAYTYVLLPTATEHNKAFLQALLRRTNVSDNAMSMGARKTFNIFYIPLGRADVVFGRRVSDKINKSSGDDLEVATSELMKHYDIYFARELLRSACSVAGARNSFERCDGDGPFLATFMSPSWSAQVSPVRIINLGGYAESSYPRVISRLTDPSGEVDLNTRIIDVIQWLAKSAESK